MGSAVVQVELQDLEIPIFLGVVSDEKSHLYTCFYLYI